VPRRLVVATTNAGKLREIRELLGGLPIDLLTLRDLPPVEAPDETGASFEENARLKAAFYAQQTPYPTVAEYSGLVIDALDGEPGIRSARYLSDTTTYPERFAAIFSALDTRPARGRRARFVCALAVARGTGILFETTQTIEGEIAAAASGAEGFGYDPIFFFPPYGRTLAEVSRHEKLAVAHRGKAFRALAAWLQQHPDVGTEPG
jgi:XTP/dITP diphosphohydrolase